MDTTTTTWIQLGDFFIKNHLWTMPIMSKGRMERRRMRSRRRTTWPILISCWRSTTSGPLLESLSNFGPLQKKHLHIASNIKKPKAVISHQGSDGGGLEALVKSAQQTIVDFQQVPLLLIYEKISELKPPWERLLTMHTWVFYLCHCFSGSATFPSPPATADCADWSQMLASSARIRVLQETSFLSG